MNAIVSAAFRHRSSSEIIEHADGAADFVVSPQFTCHYDGNEAILWSMWEPRGIPSFNSNCCTISSGQPDDRRAFPSAREDRPLRYMVCARPCGAFNVGGDLGYFQRLIGAQDRARLTEYARAAVNVVYRNYTAHNLRGVTTIALLEGDALGGGFECALSCDIVIAEKHVKAGFPEVLFNMFPGMGGMSFLARRVGRQVADQMVRTGRQYTAQELLEMGVIDQVVETGEGVDAVQRLIRKREHQTRRACGDELGRPADSAGRPAGTARRREDLGRLRDAARHPQHGVDAAPLPAPTRDLRYPAPTRRDPGLVEQYVPTAVAA